MSRLRELLGDLGPNGRRGLVAGAAAALVLGLALLLGPVVRWQVGKRAVAWGLLVEVDSVVPGWGGVWLRDVRTRSGRSAALDARLSHVWVPLGSGAIVVHGGEVRLRGSPEEVQRALRGEGQSASVSGVAPKQRRAFAVNGVALSWAGLPGGGEVRGWGLSFSRGSGVERAGAALLRVSRPGLGVEARRVGALFSTRNGRVLTSATGARVDVELALDELRSRPASAPSGSAAPPGASSASNVAGWVALARAAAMQALPEGAEARLAEVRLEVGFGGERLGFGPSLVEAKRHAGEVTVSLAPTEAAGVGATPLSLRGRMPLLGGEPSLELEGGPVPLAVLGVRDGQLGLTHTRETSLEAHLSLTLVGGGTAVRASGSGRVQNLSVDRPALSRQEIRGLRLGFRGAGELSFDGSRLALDDAEVAVGDVKLAGSFELTKGPARRLRSKGGVPLASCASLLSSLPAALTSELGGLELEGTFSLTYDVDIDVSHLDKTHVKLDVKNDCRVKKVPRELSAGRFRSIWTREVKGPEGTTLQIQTGPGAPNWVPYDRIPRFMEIAVLVCEDGGFYRHRGFDFRAIEKAIRADVEAGRFARGASTISMQLAKNLYLGGEKTLSRKIQEAFFTMVLEQELTKQELMELYLNIVELGPGIFGIQAAADYYFASDASSLTLAQSLYLASILPDPTRQHFQPDGSVRKGWADYLKKLMHIARSVDRITDEELAAGLEEEIGFRRPGATRVHGDADAATPLDEPIPEGVPTELGP